MKKVILLILFLPVAAFGQISETFESGSVSNWVQSVPGHWKADTVSAISGLYSLHHVFDNPDAGSDKAGVSIKDLHPSLGITKWSFTIRHGYDPSSSNNWAVFLMSDSDPASMSVENGTNGFAAGVNITGYDDTLRLYKVKGNILTQVINTRINWQTEIGVSSAVKINIERTAEGVWTMSVLRLNGTLVKTSSGTDIELFKNSWFGILFRYSSTRDRLLWIDNINIEGTFFEDNKPPVVNECKVTGRNSVELIFNEEPDVQFYSKQNFTLNEEENKTISVERVSAVCARIVFTDQFRNKTQNILKVKQLCDKTGNCASDVLVPFEVNWAEAGDVVISEIMADPLPEVSLPGREYLEITNATAYQFNIKNWRLVSGDQLFYLPAAVIGPSEIYILCQVQDTSLFRKYGKVAGLKTFPVLTDAGKILSLEDSTGSFIHGVEYSSKWYNNTIKSAGGWSLEITDIHNPFFYTGNWGASVSKSGGTPGAINSRAGIINDHGFAGIVNVFPSDSNTIELKLSDPVLNQAMLMSNITIVGVEVDEVIKDDPLFRSFILKTKSALKKSSVYRLKISPDLKNFAGNPIQKSEFVFGLTEKSAPGDLQFNELLFNPFPGGQDYIEFYNNSEKILDASRFLVVSISDDTRDTSAVELISSEKRCIMPGSYYAITTDKGGVAERYISGKSEFIFETSGLPSMSDTKGHLLLMNKENEVVDNVFYDEKMHFSLLASTEGVSLEKGGTGLNSAERMNWHSASESCGWGTPGAPNSAKAEFPSGEGEILFSSTKISPDNDGYEDYLSIAIKLLGLGNVVSVFVFDDTGTLVRKVAENLFAGAEAALSWDGTGGNGKIVPTGIYIVLITSYNDTGKKQSWKKVCTVINR